jgi:opacity protein-like surface antigen
MRTITLAAAAACGMVLCAAGANAQTRGGQIQGFGGSTFGTTTSAPTFGASIAVPLGDHVQVVGEGGRLTDIKASLLDAALDFTPLDVGMSAWYAEGGLRLLGSRGSTIRPYAEATAGVARLQPSVGLDGWLGAVTNTGLAFLSETDPLVGAGAGVLVQSGPLAVDLGYRYKRIIGTGGLASGFALGSNGFNINQVRIGLGVRF